jgi:hypothetical protein
MLPAKSNMFPILIYFGSGSKKDEFSGGVTLLAVQEHIFEL